jgi:dienelactone hydrolase
MYIYENLGIFSDWVEEAYRQTPLFPLASPGSATQAKVREVLGFTAGPEKPLEFRIEDTWNGDEISGEVVSWSVGYGPRTQAFVLKPSGMNQPLPGIIALHDHGGFKYFGKEKIADGPHGIAHPVLEKYRSDYYGRRAYANALAREGFVVLVHDTFLWGSRKFERQVMSPSVNDATRGILAIRPPEAGQSHEIVEYNLATHYHEHEIAKYCNILGTSLAGVVSHEDRIAVNYLLSRPDVLAERVGCIGLSGGGNRAALLQATHDSIRAAVIVGLMSTYAELISCKMSHTWMFFPFGWARYGDWPDLAACRAPSPLLVQYDEDDDLFTLKGMRDAHERIAGHYERAGHPEAYVGQFYPGPHKFDLAMQKAAFAWLIKTLKA